MDSSWALPLDDVTEYSCTACNTAGKSTLAEKYCIKCDVNMCSDHTQLHFELMGKKHKVISIDMMRKQRLASLCAKHGSKTVTMGCYKCLQVFCTTCLKNLTSCHNKGDQHGIVPVQDISDPAKDELEEIKTELQSMCLEIQARKQNADAESSHLDDKFAAENSKIAKIRDDHLATLRRAYDNLEIDVASSYEKSKSAITSYKTQLAAGLEAPVVKFVDEMEEAINSDDKMHVITTLVRLKDSAKTTLAQPIPKLCVSDVKLVKRQDDSRSVEAILHDAEVSIKIPNAPTTTGMTFIEAIQVRSKCLSVTYHQRKWYVGVDGGVDVIENELVSAFITMNSGCVSCVRIHNEQLYLLHGSADAWKVLVYALNGTMLRSWNHEDSSNMINKFTIINDRLYIPSRKEKKIFCYTITGDRLTGQDIYIDEMSDHMITLCATSRTHVIMSQFANPPLVTCICTDTGNRLWTEADLEYPGGLTTDKSGHLIVCTGGKTTVVQLEMMNAEGKKIGTKLLDAEVREKTWISDLCIGDDDIIAVPRRGDKKVYLYKLQR